MAKTSSGSFDLKEPPPPWQSCQYCLSPSATRSDNQHHSFVFKSAADFVGHLRQSHCTVEGGSFVCRYGYNGVCSSLPLDGVCDRDYETHVTRCHVNAQQKDPHIKWSVFCAAQNLPAVLNDPSRGKQTYFFTKKWGDTFSESATIPGTARLPDVRWEQFEAYRKRIGVRYRVHTRIANVPTADATSQRALASDDRLPNGVTASLADIPEVFLKQQLELHRPATFAAVFSGIGFGDATTTSGGEQARQSSRQLQERLSHYLDIVEVLIAKQVADKSSAFFHAMTSQDAIMEQMAAGLTTVRRLRTKIAQIDEAMVHESLKVIRAERVRSNNNRVLEKLKLMATVHQTQPMIQLLLSTQDYVAALDLISTTQEILGQELTGVHCFRHLPSQLSEMELLIDKMLKTDFERYSTADLNRPLSGDSGSDRCSEKVLEEDKLICIISGLLRKRSLDFIDTYRDEAITTVRAIVKQLVIEVIASGDAEVCLTGAGEEAQSLSLAEWITLLESATGALLKLLQRIRAVHDVMQQTADASAGKITDDVSFIDTEAFLSPTDYGTVQSKLANLLASVCNYCHERCANLVSNKSLEKSGAASAEQIVQLSTIVERFAAGCETVCGVASVPLKLALRAQANRFAQKFHAERKSKLALLLDSERWKQAEVPAEFQTMVDCIARGDFHWCKTAGADQQQQQQLHPETNGNGVTGSRSTPPSQPPQSVLVVDGEPFALVGAALLLVQIVGEYCRCASQLPVIASQLARSVVDLLRTFNSRCCQLVLGAGALHVAGLKTITSSNLALVSRALQLVLWLLPHVKRHFQSLEANASSTLPPTVPSHPTPPNGASHGTSNGVGSTGSAAASAGSGYDTVEKDFISHIGEIESKVLSIVCELVSGQLNNWDARPPVPSQPFRNISRQFVKLHEAIAPILPERQVHAIYRTVQRNFKDKLREQLLRNNITNNGGPQHGVVVSELTFYMETLRSLRALPSAELHDDTLDDIWLK
ncbi:vacuolar protein sorting-associated protein 54-like [Anopheles albimanus]|uniref:Vacuolar protein sorting-associated protein 54 n=1 Tax=Anopheles albimanus TaxID=7167 RepID=A0A182F4S8_ANOAL|nr:vacuolar protein sorting-associated protein 54-like [Anopheles albimanus]XP_035781043.1 vacuolar protein sorting-associated protein 54-like [Anopheles albimanus]